MEFIYVVYAVVFVVLIGVGVGFIWWWENNVMPKHRDVLFRFKAGDLRFAIYEGDDGQGYYIRLFEDRIRYVPREELKGLITGGCKVRGEEVWLTPTCLVVGDTPYYLYDGEVDSLKKFINEL